MQPVRLFLTFLVVTAGFAAAARAQTVVVSFSFEGTIIPETGASRANLTWNSGGPEGYVGTVFNGLGQALSIGNFQIDDYFQFTIDASGFRDLRLENFRANGTGSAPRDWKISYSLTGASGPFVDVATYTLASNVAVNTTTISGFALPEEANDLDSIILRLVATSSIRIDGNDSLASGTVRLDQFVITGTAIPEPATAAALAGLAGLLAVLGRRRRTISVATQRKQKGPPGGGPA